MIFYLTEARWHIGMSSASHREDPGSNPGKGQFFRIKMKDVTFELLRCSYSHIYLEACSLDQIMLTENQLEFDRKKKIDIDKL